MNEYSMQRTEFYSLGDDGEYTFKSPEALLVKYCGAVRKAGQPVEQHHIDIAASLQETLERLVFHALKHYRERTGLRNLCMAGGVSHNCTMNGKIRRSG